LEGEVKQLRLETERLMEEIRALKTDPEVIERIAREELHMVRPDEMVLSFPEAPKR
jgi:cell division protein FtsB